MEVAKATAGMSKMATHRLVITPTPKPANYLRSKNTDEEVTQYLAALSHLRIFFFHDHDRR
jgi:hypothetical protein